MRPPVVPSQRKPLGNATANGAGPVKRFDPEQLKDLSNNNKENIPPWLAGRDAIDKIKRDGPLAAVSKPEVVAPRPVARDLRQAVGPEGVGITAHRVEVDHVPVQTAPAVDTASVSKTSLSRHRSVPRLSLDEVLSGRSKTLRRSATDHTASLATAASSEVEEEQLDTILPPRKLLSRASSSSSLSLLTTSGGRASLGSMDLRKEGSPFPQTRDAKPSLTSSLPPKLTAALQRQGIIAMQPDEDAQNGKGQGLLQMMPSSSASSSEADAFYAHDQRRDSEEDEERTLKMIAQRRAAKAQASALVKAQEARERAALTSAADRSAAVVPMEPGCADARQAIVQQAGSSSSSVLEGATGSASKKSSAVVVGLGPARQLSLDWAAGRDRASTSALPMSIGGTPLSRSVSARQLTMPRPDASTPLATQRVSGTQRPDSAPTNGEKRKAAASTAGRRSLSATDLTRRLQEAKRKGDAAKRSSSATRKRSAAALEARDENVDPATIKTAVQHAEVPAQHKPAAQPAKRRRAQLDDVALSSSLPEPVLPPPKFSGSMASPLLSSRPFVPHASFPSASSRGMPTMVVPSTPQSSTALYGGIPLSTRSDRFRAIGASPATSLGRSISANYPSHRALPRPSAARDQIAPGRGWDLASSHTRTYSEESGWTPRTSRGVGESLVQPLALTASTPSRVLGDRTNLTPGMPTSSVDSPFMHDDSGFFGTMSDDEEHQQLVRGKRPISPRKASLRNVRGGESGDDHQAAELLLGLGKTVGSRDSSLSQ